MNLHKVSRLIFDADDTLWGNNIYYIQAAENLADLVGETGISRETFEKNFQLIERKYVKNYGYGSKIYLQILKRIFEQYLGDHDHPAFLKEFEIICREFTEAVSSPPKIFPDVREGLKLLSARYQLYVLTKGNIEEQKKKLIKSGLLPLFRESFVVSEKNLTTYERILSDKSWKADDLCMIGNSPKSDINPALKIGMSAIYIPYEHTWVLEDEPLINHHPRLKIIPSFKYLQEIFL